MPQTKEEIKAYKKEYYQRTKEERKEYAQTKEEKALYDNEYRQTPAGKKTQKKKNWKKQGIIIDDFDKFYDLFLSITQCQICKKKLTIDKKMTHSTKCVDHDHNINDRENVRYICCNACNANDNSRNTSGEPNICYLKRDKWRFEKIIKGKRYAKTGFKTKQEAIHYKYSFLHKIKQIEINNQITSRLSNGTCKTHHTGQR